MQLLVISFNKRKSYSEMVTKRRPRCGLLPNAKKIKHMFFNHHVDAGLKTGDDEVIEEFLFSALIFLTMVNTERWSERSKITLIRFSLNLLVSMLPILCFTVTPSKIVKSASSLKIKLLKPLPFFEILISKHSLSQSKYYFNFYEFLRWWTQALVGKLKKRRFYWFLAAIYVPLKYHRQGVSIQNFKNLGKTFFRISRVWNIAQTWF